MWATTLASMSAPDRIMKETGVVSVLSCVLSHKDDGHRDRSGPGESLDPDVGPCEQPWNGARVMPGV